MLKTLKNVAIRGKGNTSLSSVNNGRYSYKIEFDHYDNTNTYYGLDKLALNNIIQDNTYMKDYLTYTMMKDMGVSSPLCSFVYITVNGEDWGLYLAVEGVEESFLQRNYGKDYGELYKPDSMSMGGGRGNGNDFDFDSFMGDFNPFSNNKTNNSGLSICGMSLNGNTGTEANSSQNQRFGGMIPPDFSGANLFGGQTPDGMTPPTDENGNFQMPENINDIFSNGFGGFGGMGSSDVKLQYIDDNISSYENIFNNAKTKATKADKKRLIEALKKLSGGEDLESTVEVEEVIRYFVVHNFVVNSDSYTGAMIQKKITKIIVKDRKCREISKGNLMVRCQALKVAPLPIKVNHSFNHKAHYQQVRLLQLFYVCLF